MLSGLSAFRRFRLYQIFSASRSVPIFIGAFQVSAFAFPFPAAPTLSEILSRDFRSLRGDPDTLPCAAGSPLAEP
ncbi:hypothetical protein FH965_28535 [Streptomyces spectabilis]|uniref:Uncharacterized protein n=1 Tax=Streptomyces spectabilis TaxID=68270 RepID=A0A516REE8_STRST|nr:hypothetical protein FH965_28535 [Streptomyces spectabilis]